MKEFTPYATDSASAVRLKTGRRIRQRRQQLNISVADLAEGGHENKPEKSHEFIIKPGEKKIQPEPPCLP